MTLQLSRSFSSHADASRTEDVGLPSRNANLHWLWLISFALVSCNNAKYTQCQQMIGIANQVNPKTQEVINQSSEPIESQIWLQAATMMAQTAEQINGLSLDDAQLVNYQEKLVEVFRTYSQATNDAVEARKTKNLQGLKSAVEQAQKAGLLKAQLVTDINNYCLNE